VQCQRVLNAKVAINPKSNLPHATLKSIDYNVVMTFILNNNNNNNNRDQPNSLEKMRDFTVEFLKFAEIHEKFTEGV